MFCRNAILTSTLTLDITNLELISTDTMLPNEIIAQLSGEFQCRDQQIQHLAALYSVSSFDPLRITS
jgi:hypothetical protein